MGIDLTTYAAGVNPPADPMHPIYQFPSHKDFPNLSLDTQEICAKLYTLEGKVLWMQMQMEQQSRKRLSLLNRLLLPLKDALAKALMIWRKQYLMLPPNE